MTHVTQIQALRLLARATMRDFNSNDWLAFAGCETTTPLIGELDDYSIVLDGDVLNIAHKSDNCGGQIFNLKGKGNNEGAFTVINSRPLPHNPGEMESEIILCYLPTNEATPWATWRRNKSDGARYWGHYFFKPLEAFADFEERKV